MEENKNKLQNKELQQVVGGQISDMEKTICCKKCNAAYFKTQAYPDGFYLRTEEKSCSSETKYYKCPNCGYEWSED